jgi:hypothetical protein
MAREFTPLVDLASAVGPAPEGVDHIDFIIATLPGPELARSAKNSTFSYEGLAQIVRENPTFLERYNQVPHPSRALADEILMRQQKLSGPRRRLATVASIIAIGAGGFFAGYKMDEHVQYSIFGNPPHVVEGVQPGGVAEELQDGAITGGAVAILGGFATSFACLSQTGRMARRPAQKLVDRARVTQSEV